MYDNHEIWDEFKWEEFMEEQDKMVTRYMELFYRYQNDPQRDEIIAREMGWSHFFEDNNDKSNECIPGECEECDDGEEWKKLLDDRQITDAQDREFDNILVCRKSKEHALRVLKIVDTFPESIRKKKCVVEFVSNTLIASAKIAGGTDLGEEPEDLGANIAFCKRGLAAANLSINALTEMKNKRLLSESLYMDLLKDAINVRDEIAVYVVDLREKFNKR